MKKILLAAFFCLMAMKSAQATTIIGTETIPTITIGTVPTSDLKATAGNVMYASVYNANAAARYLWIFNATSSTAALANAKRVYLIPATNQIALSAADLGGTEMGLYCDTAIAWGFSTSPTTFTVGAGSDCVAQFEYR